jgi:hypothetical protein
MPNKIELIIYKIIENMWVIINKDDAKNKNQYEPDFDFFHPLLGRLYLHIIILISEKLPIIIWGINKEKEMKSVEPK